MSSLAWSRRIAAIGAATWLAVVLLVGATIPGAALLLAALVVVPLALGLAPAGDEAGRGAWRIARGLQPCAALLLALSCGLAPGPLALALAVPWVALTWVVAAAGALRMARRGPAPSAEACIDGGCVLLAVGGAWTAATRLGARPLGFDDLTVTLTAVHFHFAALGLPLLAGLTGRARGRLPWPICAALLGSVPAVAVGITASPLVEFVGAWAVALAGFAVIALTAPDVLRPGRGPAARVALGLSCAAGALGMAMAASFALATYLGASWPTIEDMLPLHGAVNAVGFVGLGLLGRALDPPVVALPALPPLPPLGGGLRIGPGWFATRGLVPREASPTPPVGQVDRLEDLAGPTFAPALAHPLVRTFYEDTDPWEFWASARWTRGLGPGARLASTVCGWIGQSTLPVDARWREIVGRIGALDGEAARPLDRACGRRLEAARTSVRTWRDDGTALFVARYATFEVGGQRHLSVTLPAPLGSLQVVLGMSTRPDGAIRLGTARPADLRGPWAGGMWLVTAIGALRLPIAEDLHLGPAGALADVEPPPDLGGRVAPCELVARQTVSLAGLPLLVTRYGLRRAAHGQSGWTSASAPSSNSSM